MATFKDFRNNIKPNWCPACGDFSVLAAMQRAFANLGLEPENVAVISGIGCSGRVSGYVNSYGFHGVHGRSLPLAQGLKMANKDLTVVATGGDGDGFAIGMGHTIHSIRRNINITYIVMDNQVYGLTKGQTSPRSEKGFKTKSTPGGAIEKAINPLELALTAGGTFIAQSVSSDLKGMTNIIESAIKHEGFSFVNVYSPCVTYNKINTYEWFKEHLTDVSEIEGYDNKDKLTAMQALMGHNGLLTGIIYQDEHYNSYESNLVNFSDKALVDKELEVSRDDFEELVAEFI